jgi:hypothetical protein
MSPVGTRATAGALAGAHVGADGTLRTFFNAYGGPPAVSHPQVGSYILNFPGETYDERNSIVLVTLGMRWDGTADLAFGLVYYGRDNIIVTMVDAQSHEPVDSDFHMVVHGATPAQG